MRLLFALASIAGVVVAEPVFALTMNAPTSPVSASPMRFAESDAALEQTGSALQQGFVDSAIGFRGSGFTGTTSGDAPSFNGFGAGLMIPLHAPTVADVGRPATSGAAIATPPR